MMPRAIADKLTKILEVIFSDLQEGIESAARNCHNNDASTALYEMSSAISSMDIGFHIREVLEIPHDSQEKGSAL